MFTNVTGNYQLNPVVENPTFFNFSNVNSTVFLTKLCSPYLSQTKGSVLNISSVAAKITVIFTSSQKVYF